MKPFVYIAQQP